MGAAIGCLIGGIILLGLGIYFVVKYNKEKKTKPWWVWALIVVGVILILASVVLFITRKKKPATTSAK